MPRININDTLIQLVIPARSERFGMGRATHSARDERI
jgi:hypothetical protein